MWLFLKNWNANTPLSVIISKRLTDKQFWLAQSGPGWMEICLNGKEARCLCQSGLIGLNVFLSPFLNLYITANVRTPYSQASYLRLIEKLLLNLIENHPQWAKQQTLWFPAKMWTGSGNRPDFSLQTEPAQPFPPASSQRQKPPRSISILNLRNMNPFTLLPQNVKSL